MHRHTPRVVYLLMVAWLLAGSTLRILWLLQHGFPVDALPVISILLALTAFVLAFVPVRATRAASRTDP